MPAYMRKLPNQSKWTVRDSEGHIHAKRTSKKKAAAQVRILNAKR